MGFVVLQLPLHREWLQQRRQRHLRPLPKASAAVLGVSARVASDNAAKEVTTPAEGRFPIGGVVEAAGNGVTSVTMRLHGVATAAAQRSVDGILLRPRITIERCEDRSIQDAGENVARRTKGLDPVEDEFVISNVCQSRGVQRRGEAEVVQPLRYPAVDGDFVSGQAQRLKQVSRLLRTEAMKQLLEKPGDLAFLACLRRPHKRIQFFQSSHPTLSCVELVQVFR